MERRQRDPQPNLTIRPLREDDLDAADAIMRRAFGTLFDMPDPTAFMGDGECVRTRWRADLAGAFAAEIDGTLVGSAFANNWGSVGVVGPLAVAPDYWGRGVASRLMEPLLGRFDEWSVSHAGLFTIANSPQHLHLYEKFDFWPGYLTALMGKPVGPDATTADWLRYSGLTVGQQAESLESCRALTDTLYPGLDLGVEIDAVASQGLGETVLVADDAGLAGLAICHCGAGSEAGSGVCYVKIGAAAPGPDAEQRFGRLLDACEALAAEAGLHRLTAGVNTGRHAAYRQMLARGFGVDFVGVAMRRRNAAGYNRSDAYVIDDGADRGMVCPHPRLVSLRVSGEEASARRTAAKLLGGARRADRIGGPRVDGLALVARVGSAGAGAGLRCHARSERLDGALGRGRRPASGAPVGLAGRTAAGAVAE